MTQTLPMIGIEKTIFPVLICGEGDMSKLYGLRSVGRDAHRDYVLMTKGIVILAKADTARLEIYPDGRTVEFSSVVYDDEHGDVVPFEKHTRGFD